MLYLLCLSSCTDHFKRHFWALGRLRRNRHNIAGLRSVVRYPTVKCSFVWGLKFVCGRPVEIDPTTGEVTPVAESEQGNWSFVHFRTEAARDQCIRNSGNLILQVNSKIWSNSICHFNFEIGRTPDMRPRWESIPILFFTLYYYCKCACTCVRVCVCAVVSLFLTLMAVGASLVYGCTRLPL